MEGTTAALAPVVYTFDTASTRGDRLPWARIESSMNCLSDHSTPRVIESLCTDLTAGLPLACGLLYDPDAGYVTNFGLQQIRGILTRIRTQRPGLAPCVDLLSWLVQPDAGKLLLWEVFQNPETRAADPLQNVSSAARWLMNEYRSRQKMQPVLPETCLKARDKDELFSIVGSALAVSGWIEEVQRFRAPKTVLKPTRLY